jgi:HicA toxin of bacterial toxin-antitoxin,
MGKIDKLILKILRGNADKNISFDDLVKLLTYLAFEERQRGSHHIFTKEGVEEIINLQEAVGGKAKPYQVKQVRELMVKYKLIDLEEDESDDE